MQKAWHGAHEEREPEFFAAYQSARGTFKAPVRARLDENGQPTAQWRIAKAKKAEEQKARVGTKAKKGSGSGSATKAENTTGMVPLTMIVICFWSPPAHESPVGV